MNRFNVDHWLCADATVRMVPEGPTRSANAATARNVRGGRGAMARLRASVVIDMCGV